MTCPALSQTTRMDVKRPRFILAESAYDSESYADTSRMRVMWSTSKDFMTATSLCFGLRRSLIAIFLHIRRITLLQDTPELKAQVNICTRLVLPAEPVTATGVSGGDCVD